MTQKCVKIRLTTFWQENSGCKKNPIKYWQCQDLAKFELILSSFVNLSNPQKNLAWSDPSAPAPTLFLQCHFRKIKQMQIKNKWTSERHDILNVLTYSFVPYYALWSSLSPVFQTRNVFNNWSVNKTLVKFFKSTYIRNKNVYPYFLAPQSIVIIVYGVLPITQSTHPLPHFAEKPISPFQ